MWEGMPRVSTKSTDETTKTAPRKRAVRRVVTANDDEVVAPRKRAPRKVARTAPAPEVEETPARRAPTRFAAEASSRTKQRKTLAIVAGVLVVVSGLAAWIGSTDAGQINVTARIEAEASRQPQATESVEGGESNTVTVPVQNTPPAAISGLRGQKVGTPDIVTEAPPAEEATSTEEMATSTDTATEDSEVSEEASATPTEAAPVE